jgi:hypothetical protein
MNTMNHTSMPGNVVVSTEPTNSRMATRNLLFASLRGSPSW